MPNCCSPTEATLGFVVSAVANIKIMYEKAESDGIKKKKLRTFLHLSVVSATFHVIAVVTLPCNFSSTTDVYHMFITIYLFSLREENCV